VIAADLRWPESAAGSFADSRNDAESYQPPQPRHVLEPRRAVAGQKKPTFPSPPGVTHAGGAALSMVAESLSSLRQIIARDATKPAPRGSSPKPGKPWRFVSTKEVRRGRVDRFIQHLLLSLGASGKLERVAGSVSLVDVRRSVSKSII
jgi:hypothetical protein